MDNQPEPTLVELIRYNTWANQKVMAVCLTLNESQVSAPIPGAYGSIHRTFGHLLWAEADYIKRITGRAPQPPFNWEEEPSLPELAAVVAQLGAAFLDVVQRVPPAQIVHEEEEGKFLDYQAGQLFMQVINHGIEHRTNITTYLNSQGIALPEVDGWGYMFAHRERFEVKEGE